MLWWVITERMQMVELISSLFFISLFLFIFIFFLLFLFLGVGKWGIQERGNADSSVIERRTPDRKVAGSSPDRSGGRIFFSKVNFLVLTLITVFHPPYCYRSST